MAFLLEWNLGGFRFCLYILKKLVFLTLFFTILSLQNYLAVYLENLAECFPVTLITTQKEQVENALSQSKICSVSVQSERMTFDSSIFNHYETLPVKEIYLYSVKIPYENWNEIRNLEDVIPEANPYIEEIVSFYLGSKMKFYLFSFIFSAVLGICFIFKIAASNRLSRKQFFAVFIINSISCIVYSLILLFLFPAFVMPLSATSAGVFLTAYILMTLMNYKFLKR